MNPCPTQFNFATLVLDGVSPPAKPIIGFNDDGAQSTLLEVASSCDSCQSSTNDDYIPLTLFMSQSQVDVMD